MSSAPLNKDLFNAVGTVPLVAKSAFSFTFYSLSLSLSLNSYLLFTAMLMSTTINERDEMICRHYIHFTQLPIK